MPTVTGILADFGLNALTTYAPELIFTPSGPGVTSNVLFATKPITVIPSPSTGAFTVVLQATDLVHPDVWYQLSAQWLNSTGGYVSKDFIDWKLRVPEEGGVIGDLIAAPSNPAQVWGGEAPPANPTPGTWWLVPSTGDIFEWSN